MTIFAGLTVYNLTPHDINYIDEQKTNQTRSGMRILQKGLKLEEATLDRSLQGSFTLSVVEPPMIPTLIAGNLRIFNSSNAGNFENEPPPEWLDDADVLIVSRKCAELINYRVMTNRMFPIHADKFYMPRGFVYEYVENNGYAKKGSRVLGCIGLQRVTPLWTIADYSHQIQINQRTKVSLASLCSACYVYTKFPYQDRIYYDKLHRTEFALQIINEYLERHSLRPYPTLAVAQEQNIFPYSETPLYR